MPVAGGLLVDPGGGIGHRGGGFSALRCQPVAVEPRDAQGVGVEPLRDGLKLAVERRPVGLR
jgi:hypothetical protein